MRKQYEIIQEETKDNLDTVISYLQDKHYHNDFKICYKDYDRLVALVQYTTEKERPRYTSHC